METGNLVNCWWKCKTVQPLWIILKRFIKRLNIELPYDSTFYLQLYTQKNRKQGLEQILYGHPGVYQQKTEKKNVIHTYNEILFRLEKEGNSDTDKAQDIMLSEKHQAQKDKY